MSNSKRGGHCRKEGLELGVAQRLLGQLQGELGDCWLDQGVAVIAFLLPFSQITRRYAEFSSALVSINQTVPNERTMQLLGQLQVRASRACPAQAAAAGWGRGTGGPCVLCHLLLLASSGGSGEFCPPSGS